MTIIQGDGFEVEIIRSKRRKTLALAVRNGQVSVRMPANLPRHHAESFVAQKSHWIKQKLSASPPVCGKKFEPGETFRFLGRTLTLTLISGEPRNQVMVENELLQLISRNHQPSKQALLRQLTHWYKQQAKTYLTDRCRVLAEQTGLMPGSVEVKTYKARWGSCHRNGNIQFNWKLIMAPPAVIDYVIIHELCHLQQHNHSPAFWQLVAFFDPNFKAHRAWLKENGQLLAL